MAPCRAGWHTTWLRRLRRDKEDAAGRARVAKLDRSERPAGVESRLLASGPRTQKKALPAHSGVYAPFRFARSRIPRGRFLEILRVSEVYRKRWPLPRSSLWAGIDGERSARRDAIDGDDDTGWAGQVARTRKAARQRRGDTYRLREKTGFRDGWIGGIKYHERDCCGCSGCKWRFGIEV